MHASVDVRPVPCCWWWLDWADCCRETVVVGQCRVVGGGWTGADCCRETVVVGQCRVVGGGWTGADCCCLSLARATRLLRCEFILWFRFSIPLAVSLVVSVAVCCLFLLAGELGLSRKSPWASS